jgi:NAD(P)-dependent dehydrogenase (short-subunit alcohol dehydrogenase family)
LGRTQKNSAKGLEMAGTEKRVAVVTGAGKATGIGYALCEKLAREGIAVVLTARKAQAAEELAVKLDASYPGLVIAQALDITSSAQVRALRGMIEQRFGKLDILINNAAAVSPFGERAATADLNMAKAVFDATLFGTWLMCQEFLPLLRKSKAGRIVNVSSGAGSHGDKVFGLTTGNQMGTGYAVAKAALNALTAKLALEEDVPQMRINAVCPGFTATFEGGEAMGARPASDSADGVLWAAFIGNDGPTGGFFRDGSPLPW